MDSPVPQWIFFDPLRHAPNPSQSAFLLPIFATE
jgi:hypothetical protein